jgi:hypothetical protein
MGQDDQVGKGPYPGLAPTPSAFDRLQAEDIAAETRILWSEVGIAAFVVFLSAVYLILA